MHLQFGTILAGKAVRRWKVGNESAIEQRILANGAEGQSTRFGDGTGDSL